MKKREWIIGIYAMLATISALSIAGCGRSEMALPASSQNTSVASSQDESQRTLTVTANSSVKAAPDLADLDLTISSYGADLKSTQSENTEISGKVIAKLKELGVDEKNLQTSSYNIYPQYNYDNPNETSISGYNVYNTITVSSIALKDCGSFIEACTAAGANEINNITYHISNYDEVYTEAMGKALADANAKAESLAKASGKTLGDIQSITENGQGSNLRYTGMQANLESSKAAGEFNVMPGMSDVVADITVTYYLK